MFVLIGENWGNFLKKSAKNGVFRLKSGVKTAIFGEVN